MTNTQHTPNEGRTEMDMEIYANLIAGAKTVYHETGKTPRELADENAVMLELVREVAMYYKTTGAPWAKPAVTILAKFGDLK